MNTSFKNIALLILRVLLGVFIAYAAYVKLVDMDAHIAFFASLGLSATTAWIVAIGEAAIGLGLMFGIWTRLAAAGLVIILLGAGYYTEFAAMVVIPLIVSFLLLALGGGRYALTNCKPKAVEATTSTPSSTPSAAPTL